MKKRPSKTKRSGKLLSRRRRLSLVSLAVVLLAVVAAGGYLAVRHSRAAASCTVSATLVNSCRPWIGAWADNYPGTSDMKSSILDHENRIGRQMDLVKEYYPPGTVPLGTGTTGDDDRYFINRANTYMLITWKPAMLWADAAGGNTAVNNNIIQAAKNFKALGNKKVMLSIYHENERWVSAGSSCPNQQKGGAAGSPADFRAMWQNVENIFKAQGVTNVVWTDITTGDASNFSCLYPEMWPGNNLVDWIMYDPYGGGNSATWTKVVGSMYNWLSNNSDATHDYLSKPWGLAEFSIHGATNATDVAFWQGAKAALDNNTYPKLKAYLVFDSHNGIPDNRIDYADDGTVDAAEQNAYKAFANDPAFSGTATPPTATPTPTPTATPSPTPKTPTPTPKTPTPTPKTPTPTPKTPTPTPQTPTPTPTPPPVTPGDVNGDGKVNVTDLSLLESHWNTNYAASDFNHDGIINVTDLSIMLSHWTG